MTTLQQHFDQANGLAVTAANSAVAGSNAFDSVSLTSSAITYSTEQKMHGTGSMKFATTATPSTGYVRWTTSLNSATSFAWRAYLYLTGIPSAGMNIVYTTTPSDTTRISLLNVLPGGQVNFNLTFADGTQSNYTIPTGTFALATGTWYRIEGSVVLSTTAGSMLLSIYAGDSTTPLTTLNPTGIKTVDAAGIGVASFQFGKNTGSPTVAPYYFDDVAFTDSATLLGPYSAAAPTVTAAASLSASALSLSAVPHTYDNAVTSYAWAQTSGATVTLTGATTASPSATLTTAGSYGFRVTITDDLGQTATATATATYVGTTSAPAVSGTSYTGRWVEAVVGTPAGGGTMSYTISPSTGVTQHAPGVFSGAMPTSATAYTVTATESGNSNTTVYGFTIPGAATPSGTLRILVASADQSSGGSFS